jgi:hypothetical protein
MQIITQAILHYRAYLFFFERIEQFGDDPELRKAMLADGVDVTSEDCLFVDADDTFKKLNSPGSKTRDWLILKNDEPNLSLCTL